MKDTRAARGFPRRSPIAKRRPGALIWPEDLMGRCARVTAIGSGRLLIENHTGLLELTDTRVRLNTGMGPLTVTGEDLQLCEARPRAMIVTGVIRRVDLPCQGGDGQP